MERVYLDHAATTPVDPEVAEAMTRVLRETHGNPSSIYAEGRAARALVDGAREQVADAIGAHPSEVVFTSGGTEADNLALRGRLKVEDGRDGLVTSAIEHHAVIDTARDLAAHGQARLSVIGVDRHGQGQADQQHAPQAFGAREAIHRRRAFTIIRQPRQGHQEGGMTWSKEKTTSGSYVALTCTSLSKFDP